MGQPAGSGHRHVSLCFQHQSFRRANQPEQNGPGGVWVLELTPDERRWDSLCFY